MNVTQYTFQSPYPHQVQVGRVDPNSAQESQSHSSETSFATNQTLSEAQNFQASQKTELTPKISANEDRLLDIYA